MMKFLRFFKSKKFIFNLIAIGIVWLIVIFGTKLYLSSHTNFGEKIVVPSFYKLHVDDLDEFISDKNIKIEIVDSVFMEGWPKGTVCWQHPMPSDSTGEFVKSGRLIQLSIVPTKPKMIKVPDVTEKSKRMAETQLESLGLRTRITYEPSVIGSGFVLAQKINGKDFKLGTVVPIGTVINIIVARGGQGESTALPNLVGLTITQAKERLLNLTLSLHHECETCITAQELENAVIVKQSPNGGMETSVAAGTIVTVWAEKQ